MRKPIALVALCFTLANAPPSIVSLTDNGTTKGAALPVLVSGRVEAAGSVRTGYKRQWPGTYFETAFVGAKAFFKIGDGDVIVHVSLDGKYITTLIKPTQGLYRVDTGNDRRHDLRIDIVSESQGQPTLFGGFFGAMGTRPVQLSSRRHQIEFIGDSFTVGYANTSTKQDCTQDEVWRSTDTSRSFGPLLARLYDADYQVNAISGRGMVRNYNGFAADPLPVAYQFNTFDKTSEPTQANWRPGVIVVSLGTNDFTTALHDGEKWKTRAELHADFESTYKTFIRGLRAKNPHAYFILWATEKADGEIQSEVKKVADSLRASGEHRLDYVAINGLSFSACHSHPSQADDKKIADILYETINQQPNIWNF